MCAEWQKHRFMPWMRHKWVMIHCGAHGEHLSRYSICMRPFQLESGERFPDIQLRDRMTTADLQKRGKHSCLPMAVSSLPFKPNGNESEDPDSLPWGRQHSAAVLRTAPLLLSFWHLTLFFGSMRLPFHSVFKVYRAGFSLSFTLTWMLLILRVALFTIILFKDQTEHFTKLQLSI